MTKPFSQWDYDDAANAVQAKLALLDMGPDFATSNLGNNSLIDSVFTGQSRLSTAFTFSKFLLNLPHLLIGKFRDAVIFPARGQSDFKSVFGIARVSYIFQIFNSVISFHSVNVINIMSGWFWANECSSDKTLHRVSSFLSGKTKHGVPVAAGSFNQFQDTSGLGAAALLVSSNPTETGDGIDSGEPPNNRAPFFCLQFFGAKFVGRHGMNLLHRFVSSLGWGGVKASFQSL